MNASGTWTKKYAKDKVHCDICGSHSNPGVHQIWRAGRETSRKSENLGLKTRIAVTYTDFTRISTAMCFECVDKANEDHVKSTRDGTGLMTLMLAGIIIVFSLIAWFGFSRESSFWETVGSITQWIVVISVVILLYGWWQYLFPGKHHDPNNVIWVRGALKPIAEKKIAGTARTHVFTEDEYSALKPGIR